MRSNSPGRAAPGEPGIDPRWTHGAKDAVGTSATSASRVWFTMHRGSVTELYYPTVDRPQVRDVVFCVSDGASFIHDEKRHLRHRVRKLAPDALGFEVVSDDPDGRYKLVKEVITAPGHDALLIRVRLDSERSDLRIFALIAPHLDGDGWGDRGYVTEIAGRPVLAGEGSKTWLMAGATAAWRHRTAGFVGRSDGWMDLMQNRSLTARWDEALDGNVCLAGEIDIRESSEFTLAIAFGESQQHAAAALLRTLGQPWAEHKALFVEQWAHRAVPALPLDAVAADGGRTYRTSRAILAAHEDKAHPGAIISSLSIPWGDIRGPGEIDRYHLVWTRNLYNSATALLAAGDLDTPLRALTFLACTQTPEGGFYQNFWADGRPYWTGIQLDEVSLPILLAWQLWGANALRGFDPWPMVRAAARYLIAHGPVTNRDRWEENCGFSPFTLATNIAGLVCAAEFARDRDERQLEQLFLDWADFLNAHVEAWTVTSTGTLVPGISRHYVRIQRRDAGLPAEPEDVDVGEVPIANRAPHEPQAFPAREVVDPGFLELVRLGVRHPSDPLIEDSVRVIDATLKIELPQGPGWHRYSHDGYGEGPDGRPFRGNGVGRVWPLLTGERAHYELARGNDVAPYVRAMEGFATEAGLLSEQLWDQPDSPRQRLQFGGPTGAATPLCWAHAEYLKLLRSCADRQVFDRLAPVADRYIHGSPRFDLDIWKFDRQVGTVVAGRTVRWIAPRAFTLRITADAWATERDVRSTDHEIGLSWVDLTTDPSGGLLQFTFMWADEQRWEGRNFELRAVPPRGY
jgi:glucoamylase